MITLPSWLVKKGFNNRQKEQKDRKRRDNVPDQWNRITEKGTMGHLKGLGDRERRMGNKEHIKIGERGRETRNH
jgi:hypothetical protein